MSTTSRRIAIALLLLAAVVCVRLGIWQLDRLADRRAQSRSVEESRALPVVHLTAEGARRPDSLADRWVEATGRYDHVHEMVIRGEAFQGVPGVHVVTPLRLKGSDTAVLVNRGFVPAPDAVRAKTDTLREPGEVTVRGLAQAISSGSGRRLVSGGRVTWARLDLAAVRSSLPYPILPFSILQSPAPGLPRLPRRLEPPPTGDGPHLNYAIQWFLFAGMAATFALVVVARPPTAR